jgi:signal transduction histidine kinase
MTLQVEFFALNEQVAQIEVDLPLATGGARLRLLLNLAWQLRQSDTRRCLQLVDEVQGLLDAMPAAPASAPETRPESLSDAISATQRQAVEFRLCLIRAEAQSLFGELLPAKTLAHHALQGFQTRGDACARFDAYFLLALIAGQQNCQDEVELATGAMPDTALECADPVRLCIARALWARQIAPHDVAAVDAQLRMAGVDQHPAAACQVEAMLACLAAQKHDHVAAIGHSSRAFSLARSCGQLLCVIVSACHISAQFNQLNEFHSALEWGQRGLEMARQADWPFALCTALTHHARTLRHMQDFDDASRLLREALDIMANQTDGSLYANALLDLAEVELERKHHASALELFQRLEQSAMRTAGSLRFAAQYGQARALFASGQSLMAMQVAKTALAESKAAGKGAGKGAGRADPRIQMAVLRLIAEIHARNPLPAPPEVQERSAALHYLKQVLLLSTEIADYDLPGDLLDMLAQECAKLGDHQQAWQYATQAGLVREKIQQQQADQRAAASEVIHQIERDQIELAHQRELAEEAKRAEILRQTSETLAHLGAIGQEITAHLEIDLVFESLKRHVQHLLKADYLAIFITDPDGLLMQAVYCVDNGIVLPRLGIAIDNPISDVARCARERCEIVADQDPLLHDPRWLWDTTPTLSRLFLPLCQQERVLGVITVQSRQRHAYGAREQLISRTLCAYTAIALGNASAHGELARAHQQLQQTQQQLVLQGKMAGLGTLTAGVAHEINNPANFAHVAAQNQQVDLAEFARFVNNLVEQDAGPEILAAFQQRFARLNENVSTLINGTERIKGIVRDLRTFTRLDEAEKKAVRLSECLHSTLNLVRANWLEKVEFCTDFSVDPELECWPALLNQVFMNLLVNACQAIDEKRQKDARSGLVPERGKLCLGLHLNPQQDNLVISFQDTGIGMDAALSARIMEPFYTTKAVGVGTGLGLSIAFGIVQKHAGHLAFTSTPGVGSCFTIQLPLCS